MKILRSACGPWHHAILQHQEYTERHTPDICICIYYKSQFNSRSPQQFFTYFHRDDGAMVMICLSKVAHLIRLHRGFVEFQVLAVAQAETPILCEFAPTD